MAKKSKSSNRKLEITPDEAVQFIEDMRLLRANQDEPTIAISVRIPGNILRSLKLRAKADGKKYQSLIVQYLRRGLSDKL